MAITGWNRLEPVPRAPDLTTGLRAELADPLWLLARQWQFGELSGEDAGSPVDSVITVETARLSRLHPGPIASNAAARSVDVADPSVPLEPLVERRPVAGTTGDLRLVVEAGQHFLRLLTANRARTQRSRYNAAYPLVVDDDQDVDAATEVWLATVVGRVPDGRRIATDLLTHRGTAAELSSLPAEPAVAASARRRVLDAANAFLRWWESFVLEPPASADSWVPRRLEYGFAVQATLSDGHVVLRADDYGGGRLDWYEFEADTEADLGAPQAAPAPRTLVRHSLPTRAFYAGMPAERFWEFEDSSVRFGVGSVGRTDIAHMLLNEFALTYGNDWFVVPLTVPVGSICAVRDLTVVDSFGIETKLGRSAAGAADPWSMYELSVRPGAAARAAGLFLLPSTLGVTQEGDPVEEVAWFRDEMANVVWAVERRTESATGGHVDRYEHVQQLAPGSSQHVVGDVGEATLVYRLHSWVPENWFPLVPVQPRGAPPGVVELELRSIRRVDPDGSARVVEPSGRFLTAADPLRIAEEEIGRDGVVSQAHWELTRGHDGRYLLWLSNRVQVGRGEGSSGLVFDVARPVQ